MPGQDSRGRYVQPGESISGGTVASAARTETAAGTAFDTSGLVDLTATLEVTDRDGTNPTLDVELQTSGDAGATFEKVSQFTQVVAGSGVASITIETTVPGDDDPATDEVQVITFANADGGTFTATYSGQTTAAIAFPPTSAAFQSALIALSNLATGDVVVTGAAGGPYTLTFGGTLAATNVDEVTASAAGLSGTDLTAEVKVFGPLGEQSKWAWTIGGTDTPTFTFAVSSVTGDRDN